MNNEEEGDRVRRHNDDDGIDADERENEIGIPQLAESDSENEDSASGEESDDEPMPHDPFVIDVRALDPTAGEPGNRPAVRRILRRLLGQGHPRGLLNIWAASSSDESESDDGDADEAGEVVDFDPANPSEHRYLWSGEATRETDTSAWLEPGKPSIVPAVQIDTIVLPGQRLPLHSSSPRSRTSIEYAIRNKTYLAAVDAPDAQWGTLLQINQFAYSQDGARVKVDTTARQRFRRAEPPPENGLNLLLVEALPDTVLPPLEKLICPQRAHRWSGKQLVDLTHALTGIPRYVIVETSLETRVRQLADWMKVWVAGDKVDSAVALGPTCFSYWAANNLPIAVADKAHCLREDCSAARIRYLLKAAEGLNQLACRVCNTVLCRMSDMIDLNTEGRSAHYVNNAGYVHEMFTMSTAAHFVFSGNPSSKDSWFEGYKWHIIECDMCFSHLGWEFTSRRYAPAKFYGLTRRAVIPIKPVEE